MRILHVLGKLDRGGVETWLVQVLRHIDREKYQMDFLVHTTDAGAYDEEVRSLGARIIPCLGHTNPARYARNFLRILRQHGPYDVVHSHVHHFSGYVLMLSKMGRVPVRIAHSHTSAPEPNPGFTRKCYLNLMLHLIKGYASLGLVVSSRAGNSLFPSWRDDPKWHVRPYGIELAPFEEKVDPREIRGRLGIPSLRPVVGHVGRFVEVKNHELIIAAAAELVKLMPQVMFVLVGDGPLRGKIEGDIRGHGLSSHFILTGIRADVAEILKGGMDAFLFPSFYEGLGIALMEAQLAGLRCVVSDVVPPEAELSRGMVSWLSLSAPPRKWAESLHAILTASGSCAVPEQVRAEYSIAGSVSHLTGLYRSGADSIHLNAVNP